jgi:sulfatase modifying factor 1
LSVASADRYTARDAEEDDDSMAALTRMACCLVAGAGLMAASCSRVIGLDKLTFGSPDGSADAGAEVGGEGGADTPAAPTDAGTASDRAAVEVEQNDGSTIDARTPDDRSATPDGAVSDAGLAGDRVALPDGRLLPSGYGDQPPNPYCKGSHGPTPVVITGTISANTFCMDATPVTNSQYKVFLDSSPSVLAQDNACLGNSEFFVLANRPLLTEKPNYPVVFVDFCDAQAYCVWAGKRLCGLVGDRGPGIFDAFAIELGELFYACSMNAQRYYPYGNTYSEVACGTAENDPILPVASRPACEGGFPGVFDLSGEVSEWEDLCEMNDPPGLTDFCRKGAFGSGVAASSLYFRCDNSDSNFRQGMDQYTGFRCCSDVAN